MRGKTIHELLDEYRSNKGPVLDIGKLYFNGIDGLDVYNPTSPFSDKDAEALIARVEPRDTEYSHILFFTKKTIPVSRSRIALYFRCRILFGLLSRENWSLAV